MYKKVPTPESISILYGGSAAKENAEAFMKKFHIDGFLVGGKSTTLDEFVGIIKAAEKAAATMQVKPVVRGNLKTYKTEAILKLITGIKENIDPAKVEVGLAPEASNLLPFTLALRRALLGDDKAKLNESDIITSLITKSSSAGISVELSRVPALLKNTNIDLQEGIILTLEDTLKSNDRWDKLFTAIAFSRLDKNIMSPYIDGITPTLEDALKSNNRWDKLLAVIVFSSLDKDMISPYIDRIIPIIEDALRSGNPWYKLFTAIAFSRLDKNIMSSYIDEITPALEFALKSDNRWDRLLAVTAFSSLDKNIVSPLTDQIIPIIEDALKNGDPWYKLLTAIAFSSLDKDIMSPYIDGITPALEYALKSDNPWDKLLTAIAFSSLDKDIIAPLTGWIIPVLEDALKSKDLWDKLFAVIAFSSLDKDIISPLTDRIIPILEVALKSKDLWDKLLAAIAFSSLDKDIISPLTDRMIPVLEDALKSNNPWDKLFATVIILALDKGEPPLIKININYTGLNQPYTILAKDITELSQKLNEEVLSNLGISSSVLSDNEIEFKTTINGKELIMIADITKEQALEEALLSVIATKVFVFSDISDSVSSTKPSSAGIQEPQGSDFKYYGAPFGIGIPNQDFKRAMNILSSEELDVDWLETIIGWLKGTMPDYEEIIEENAEGRLKDAAKFNLQYAEDTVKTIEGILNYGIRLQEYEGLRTEFTGKTILKKDKRLIPWFLDRDTALGKQIATAQKIGELKEIEEGIGCKAILFTPGEDSIPALLKQNEFSFNAHAIGISTSRNEKYFKEGGIKLIALDNLEQGQYLPLSLLAIYSKAMLYLSTIKDPKIHGKLMNLATQLHNSITNSRDGSTLIKNYLKTGMIRLELPRPKVVYEEGELENLQKQEVAAMRAA